MRMCLVHSPCILSSAVVIFNGLLPLIFNNTVPRTPQSQGHLGADWEPCLIGVGQANFCRRMPAVKQSIHRDFHVSRGL